MTSETKILSGGSTMALCVAIPDGAGPFPALVVAHHRGGVDDFTRAVCDRLAQSGFVAAAPNLYHRRPADEDSLEARKYLEDGHTITDVNATLDHLFTLKVRRDAIGVMGHCMGGRTSFLCAASIPVFRAAAMCYGGGIMTSRADNRPPPFEFARDIRCPIAGFFGRDDKNPSPEDVAKISAELDRYHVRHDFRTYDGAGHAFQDFTTPKSYREQQSDDAWRRIIPFFKAELGRS